jgi:hypothetical protein
MLMLALPPCASPRISLKEPRITSPASPTAQSIAQFLAAGDPRNSALDESMGDALAKTSPAGLPSVALVAGLWALKAELVVTGERTSRPLDAANQPNGRNTVRRRGSSMDTVKPSVWAVFLAQNRKLASSYYSIDRNGTSLRRVSSQRTSFTPCRLSRMLIRPIAISSGKSLRTSGRR